MIAMCEPTTPLSRRWQEDADQVLFDPIRLFIMAFLVSPGHYYRARRMCEKSGATPSAIARHIRRLRAAGYVDTARGTYNTLWVRVTPLGARTFTRHVEVLHATLTRAEQLGHDASRTGDAYRPRSPQSD